MKKSNNRKQRNGAAKSNAAASAPREKSAALSRRDALRRVRDWSVIGAVGGLGVWWVADEVMADIAERDLSLIGDGVPTVVQIHDPSCPVCTRLQREARDAASSFGGGKLRFLVANIRTPKGRAFADQNGVGHVTLLLFDGNGRRRDVLTGMRYASDLKVTFGKHIAANKER